MLEVRNITYHKEKREILSDISMKLSKQKIIGFLGPNAAGKTTLMQLLSGLGLLQSGEIEINGYTDRTYLLEHTAYMDHELYFDVRWTGKDILKHYQKNCKRFNFQKFMGMIKELDVDLTQPIKNLSRGTKERLILTLTLSQDVDYYFLDEPLTGIDMVTREEIIRTLLTFADEDATIIISSHYIDVFEMLFDEVYFIDEGKLMQHIDCEQMREEYQLTLSEYYMKIYKGGGIRC